MDDDDGIVPAAREDYWDEVPEVYDREVAAINEGERGRKGRDEIAPYGIRRGQPNTAAIGDAGMGQPWMAVDGNGKRAALDGCPLRVYWVWMDFWWGEMWI